MSKGLKLKVLDLRSQEVTSKIKLVTAREVLTPNGPAIETTVLTENGACGTNVVMTGRSTGKNEPIFLYDGGKRYRGRGVLKAVANVNKIIAPALKGMEITEQRKIDETMMSLDGTTTKSGLGVNSIASVSGAAFKAAANSLGIPLYKYIGGDDAYVLPVPHITGVTGSRRYGGGERGGGKPLYDFVLYGFKSVSEAICAGQEIQKEIQKILRARFSTLNLRELVTPAYRFFKNRLHVRKLHPDFCKGFLGLEPAAYGTIPKGKIEHDRQILEAMAIAISNTGYDKKVGIMVDVAAGCFYDRKKRKFIGLFSKKDKSREDLIDIYEHMVAAYPVVVLEDPLDEQDYEGHAYLTKKLGIEIVGDDIFAMNAKLLKKGIETGACNAIQLRINQNGTISETLDTVKYAYRNKYKVLPCGSRGEGVDIVDYAVGLCTGQLKGGGIGENASRLLQIEEELGSRAKFLGEAGIIPKK
ncbi:MAG TPA: enolase C-terminal domain-like protein [Candidatus Bathyarchaeia archaeon]